MFRQMFGPRRMRCLLIKLESPFHRRGVALRRRSPLFDLEISGVCLRCAKPSVVVREWLRLIRVDSDVIKF